MGKRRIRQWVSQPLLNVDRIRKRQDSVAYYFSHSMLRAELRAALKPLSDLERLTNRILSGHAQPRDLVAMREILFRLPAVEQVIKGKEEEKKGFFLLLPSYPLSITALMN